MKNTVASVIVLLVIGGGLFGLAQYYEKNSLEGNMPDKQGKIDIRVACESALAYTTFMNGEDADRFLEECINGEHPDVVERYIESLGVDGALI